MCRWEEGEGVCRWEEGEAGCMLDAFLRSQKDVAADSSRTVAAMATQC